MTIPFAMGKTSDGKDMIDLKSYKYKYDVKDGANFHLTNLFNGNKVLSKLIIVFVQVVSYHVIAAQKVLAE